MVITRTASKEEGGLSQLRSAEFEAQLLQAPAGSRFAIHGQFAILERGREPPSVAYGQGK